MWIEGTVYLREGATRRPLSRVDVTARSADRGELLASARTAPDGRYRLLNVPPQRILLTASRPGYYTRRAAGRSGSEILLDCSAGCGDSRKDFELVRGAVITGLVIDKLGEPVEGARISASRTTRSKGGGDETVSARAVTDDRGLFRLAGLEAGAYTVTARGMGPGSSNAARALELEVQEGQEIDGVTIILQSDTVFRVSGTVVGIEPVPSGPIGIHLERRGRRLSVEAEKDGRFDFRGVLPDKYRASAVLPGQDGGKAGMIFLGVIDVQSDMTGLILRPSLTSLVQGTVKLATGPLPSQFPLAFSSKVGLDVREVLVKAPDFSFRIPDLLPGSYDIQAPTSSVYVKGVLRGDGIVPPTDITVSAGGINRLEIVVAADHARVYGTIRQRGSGLPLPHARVALEGSNGILSKQADQAGRFLFASVVPGEYRVCAWADIRPELTEDQASWERAGCATKVFPVEPDSDVEMDLAAAP
ncbi:MAG: carboxypeptidase regulatory-like domain-containing protein [Acidobacteria bacterium]|nr:carboxypeptidase regulatory-like domain-containing protein [Acidobacteriota bacterium]